MIPKRQSPAGIVESVTLTRNQTSQAIREAPQWCTLSPHEVSRQIRDLAPHANTLLL